MSAFVMKLLSIRERIFDRALFHFLQAATKSGRDVLLGIDASFAKKKSPLREKGRVPDIKVELF